jgi:hypothetical protein
VWSSLNKRTLVHTVTWVSSLGEKSRLYFSACSCIYQSSPNTKPSKVPHIPQFSLKTFGLDNIQVSTNIKDKGTHEVSLPTKAIMAAVAYREQLYFHSGPDYAKGTLALQT